MEVNVNELKNGWGVHHFGTVGDRDHLTKFAFYELFTYSPNSVSVIYTLLDERTRLSKLTKKVHLDNGKTETARQAGDKWTHCGGATDIKRLIL